MKFIDIRVCRLSVCINMLTNATRLGSSHSCLLRRSNWEYSPFQKVVLGVIDTIGMSSHFGSGTVVFASAALRIDRKTRRVSDKNVTNGRKYLCVLPLFVRLQLIFSHSSIELLWRG